MAARRKAAAVGTGHSLRTTPVEVVVVAAAATGHRVWAQPGDATALEMEPVHRRSVAVAVEEEEAVAAAAAESSKASVEACSGVTWRSSASFLGSSCGPVWVRQTPEGPMTAEAETGAEAEAEQKCNPEEQTCDSQNAQVAASALPLTVGIGAAAPTRCEAGPRGRKHDE